MRNYKDMELQICNSKNEALVLAERNASRISAGRLLALAARRAESPACFFWRKGMENMKNVAALGMALEEIESIMEKMGGSILSRMEIDQAASSSEEEGGIWIKATMLFNLTKLSEYAALSPRQAPNTP